MPAKKSASKKQSLNFPQWMASAIQEIAEKKKCTFTDVVHELLRLELEYMGYSMGIGRQAVDVLPKVKKAG